MLSLFPPQSSTLVFHHSHTEATKIYTICRHLNKPTPIRVWLYHRNPRISEWIQPAVIIWSSSGTLESVDREEPGVAGGDPRRAPHVMIRPRREPRQPPTPRWCFCNCKCPPLPNRSLYCTTCLQSRPDICYLSRQQLCWTLLLLNF